MRSIVFRVPYKEWGKNCVLGRPPHNANPTMHGVRGDAVLIAPFTQRLRNAVYREHCGLPSIPSLLGRCRPSTITRKIPFAVIDSINRMPRARSRAHVREKVLKLLPPFTDLDTSVPIQPGIFFGMAPTTVLHTSPHTMLRGSIPSVLGVGRYSSLPLKTPTTKCVPASQIHKRNRGLFSTIAYHSDLAMGFAVTNLDDYKPPVTIANARSLLIHTTIILAQYCFVKEYSL